MYNTVMHTAIVAGSGTCAALVGHIAALAALGPGVSALYARDALQTPVLGLSMCAAFSTVLPAAGPSLVSLKCDRWQDR